MVGLQRLLWNKLHVQASQRYIVAVDIYPLVEGIVKQCTNHDIAHSCVLNHCSEVMVQFQHSPSGRAGTHSFKSFTVSFNHPFSGNLTQPERRRISPTIVLTDSLSGMQFSIQLRSGKLSFQELYFQNKMIRNHLLKLSKHVQTMLNF